MKPLALKVNPKVKEVLSNYPDFVRDKMQFLFDLVVETAEEMPTINAMEITLKWGEPSFITNYGSTLRIDWKAKSPNQYAMYFKCTSRLVKTFRLVFKNTFQYQENRAIVFELNQTIPVNELKQCIKAALIYHKVKHLITLGI